MAIIPYTGIVTFSAEHPQNRVKNLIKSAANSTSGGKWTTPKDYLEKTVEVELSIPPSYIEALDIGNCGSASIEVQVGRSDQPANKREVLLYSSILMNRVDYVMGKNREAMKFYSRDKMNQTVAEKWWDRVKVICHQPFKRDGDIFGVSTVVVRGSLRDAPKSQEKENCSATSNTLAAGVEQLRKKVETQSVKKQELPMAASRASQLLQNSQNKKPTLHSVQGQSMDPDRIKSFRRKNGKMKF